MDAHRHAPSLRRVAVIAAALCALLAFGLVGLVWIAGARLERDSAIAHHERELLLTKEVQIELLAYSRLSSLLVATGQHEIRAERDGTATEIRALLDQAEDRGSKSPAEAAALGRARAAVEAYFADRARAEAEADVAARAIERAADSFDRAAAAVQEVRALNRSDLDRAYASAEQMRALTLAFGGGMAVALVAALVAFTLWARRTAYEPLARLKDALDQVGTGQGAPSLHDDAPAELVPLLRAYDALCERLHGQRQNQAAYFGGIAHDLRNPLSALRLGLEIVRRKAPIDDRVERVLSRLEHQVLDLDRMVGDLLDAARLEAGAIALDTKVTDLRDLARDTAALYRTSSGREIVVRAPGERVLSDCDPTRLRQVLGNLITNAIKYSPDDAPVLVTVDGAEDETVVSVADKGAGIAPEAVDAIFAPFWRGPSAGAAPGAGLGLFISRRIIEAHGGHMDVESTPGAGSIFRVRLPAFSERAPVSTTAPEQTARRGAAH